MRQTYFSINLPRVFKIIGWLLMIEAAFMLVPVVTALMLHEPDWKEFLMSSILTAVPGAAMSFGIRSRRNDMGKREGFLLTASVWIFFSLFGMLPFILGPHPFSVTDAFFETMSAFTTTGVSIVTKADNCSATLLLWRSLMQWIGGMGIIMFTLAVIPMLNYSGGMQMFNAEVTGITHDKIRPRISQTVRGLWLVYLSFTVILLLLLWAGPMNFFESLCHAMSTISTGGFSTHPDGIGAFNSLYVKIVIMVFMFLGGVNFTLLFHTVTSSPANLWKNGVFRIYVWVIAGVYLFFALTILAQGKYDGIGSVTVDPLFQIISTITSTGYCISNFENWGAGVMVVIIVLMFTGACAGSTSGGAKLDRVGCAFYNMVNEVRRSLRPNAIYVVRLNGKTVPEETLNKIFAFCSFFITIALIGALILTLEGLPLYDSLFASFSCMGNTGLGAGVTGAEGSYEVLGEVSKWALASVMLIGRLEIFTVLVIFAPEFWRK